MYGEDFYLISSRILSTYEKVCAEFGLDTMPLLRRSGLSRSILNASDQMLPVRKVASLIEHSASASGARDFGLRLAMERGVPDIGPLNLLLREEPNLGAALRSLERFFHLHSTGVRLHLDSDEEAANLHCNLAAFDEPLAAPYTREMIVCGVTQTLRWLTGSTWSPKAVCFMHRAGGDTAAHRKVFRAPVYFNSTFNGLLLEKDDLSREVAGSLPHLRRHAADYIMDLDSHSPRTLQCRVLDLIYDALLAGPCTSDVIASQLGMDKSTLGRRLRAHGVSFNQLLHRARLHIISQLLLLDVPLNQVAERAGFSSLSAFSRWFRSHHGCSASQWRTGRSPKLTASASVPSADDEDEQP